MAGKDAPLLATLGASDAARESDAYRLKKEAKKKEKAEVGMAMFAGCLMAVIDACDIGLFAFLPQYFTGVRGLPPDEFGESFSFIGVALMLVGPCIGLAMRRLGGPAKTMVVGLVIFTVGRFLFCLLTFVPMSDKSFFFYAMSSIFCIEGIGQTFAEIGVGVWILALTSTENRTAALAAMAEGRTIGQLGGPSVSGIAYSLGQYVLGSEQNAYIAPFFLGVLMMLVVLAVAYQYVYKREVGQMPEEDDSAQRKGLILKIPILALVFVMGTLASVEELFFLPVLQPLFFVRYGFDSWKFGLSMTISSLFYILGAHFTPWLEKKFGGMNVVIVCTLLLGTVALGYGPSPLLPFLPPASPSTVWFPLSIMVLETILEAPISIILPSLEMRWAEHFGYTPLEASSQLMVFAMVTEAIAGVAGPFMGGKFYLFFGLKWAITVGGLGFLSVFLALMIGIKLLEPKSVENNTVEVAVTA